MRRLMVFVFLLSAGAGVAHAYSYSDYTWQEYNGHQYAATFSWSTWNDAQLEAGANGWDLVTVDDESENDWLAAQSFYGPEGEVDPSLRGAWIGLYKVDDDWIWISGEPVTFTNWGTLYGGDYAYMISVGHSFETPGTWSEAPWVGTLHGLYGIIEISEVPSGPAVPAPGAVALAVLGAGAVGWLRRQRAV